MNERYLFRGKRVDNGDWTQGSLLVASQRRTYITNDHYQQQTNGQRYLRSNLDGGEYAEAYEVNHATIGQCTGLRDKNGVLIYEGDLVRTKYGRIVSIIWFDPEMCWDMAPVMKMDNIDLAPPDLGDIWHSNNLQIVGNVHDKRLREDENNG